jgi:hypothetical protein
MAIEGVRNTLEKSGRQLTWVGGEEGDIGVPMTVPMAFGLGFANRLSRMIVREVERFGPKAQRRLRARKRREK